MSFQKKVNKLLASNYIWPSDSHYGAPILFAKKKDDGLHMCIDYCALNESNITHFSYSLPQINEILKEQDIFPG